MAITVESFINSVMSSEAPLCLCFEAELRPEDSPGQYTALSWNGCSLLRKHQVRLCPGILEGYLKPWTASPLAVLKGLTLAPIFKEPRRLPRGMCQKRPAEDELENPAALKESRLDPARRYQIFVKDLEGRTKTLEVNPDMTIEHLKLILYEKTTLLPAVQRIIWSGMQLDEGFTLGDYKIGKEVTLHLVLALRGGMHHVSSGRDDYYCSIIKPDAGGGEIRSVVIQMNEGPPLTVYIHPHTTQEQLAQRIHMESDEDYFKALPEEKLRALMSSREFRDSLSKEALSCAVAALCQYMDHSIEEEEQ
jgi:hypothetical protein